MGRGEAGDAPWGCAAHLAFPREVGSAARRGLLGTARRARRFLWRERSLRSCWQGEGLCGAVCV